MMSRKKPTRGDASQQYSDVLPTGLCTLNLASVGRCVLIHRRNTKPNLYIEHEVGLSWTMARPMSNSMRIACVLRQSAVHAICRILWCTDRDMFGQQSHVLISMLCIENTHRREAAINHWTELCTAQIMRHRYRTHLVDSMTHEVNLLIHTAAIQT